MECVTKEAEFNAFKRLIEFLFFLPLSFHITTFYFPLTFYGGFFCFVTEVDFSFFI